MYRYTGKRNGEMEITEIVLLVAGGIIFILSFLIPDKKDEVSEQSKELVQGEIADMVSREMESVRGQVDGVVEEAVIYAMEKTERSLERLSNEKIMAVNEYSDTVLAEIHKNHEEAMFLYDMLNSKHNNLKDTVSLINRTVKEVEEKINSLQEMTSVSTVQQVRPAAERTAERSAVQRMAQQTAQSATAVPSALEKLASFAAQRTARTTTAVPLTSVPAASISVPVSSTLISAAPAPVPVTNIPVSKASAPVPVTAVPVPSASAPVTVTSVPVPAANAAAGRVSFLQEKAADGRNNNERILELYRLGKSKVAIAKELGLGVGEVKLVIDLFRNQ